VPREVPSPGPVLLVGCAEWSSWTTFLQESPQRFFFTEKGENAAKSEKKNQSQNESRGKQDRAKNSTFLSWKKKKTQRRGEREEDAERPNESATGKKDGNKMDTSDTWGEKKRKGVCGESRDVHQSG